ncbi:hypothetical protein DHW03_15515 [Pedobacter yonginense]|uniref:Uncharacterized protein n=1 Tax=Pedobacter yonginense TaxID=651869 RepID=A0A317EHB0_9SPHI|nr:hypothetical protein DHW03_15515 [Pedobacter yonginense]
MQGKTLRKKIHSRREEDFFFSKPRRGLVFPANGLFRNLLLKMPTDEFWDKKYREEKQIKRKK